MMGALDNLVKGAAGPGCAEYESDVWGERKRRAGTDTDVSVRMLPFGGWYSSRMR